MWNRWRGPVVLVYKEASMRLGRPKSAPILGRSAASRTALSGQTEERIDCQCPWAAILQPRHAALIKADTPDGQLPRTEDPVVTANEPDSEASGGHGDVVDALAFFGEEAGVDALVVERLD